MSVQPDGTIRITKAAIRRRQVSRRVRGDIVYHAYGLATQACVVLMLSGIVFSLAGLRWGLLGNTLLALCAMGLLGFAGSRAVFAATHRDYGGLLMVGGIITGFLGMLVGEHVAAGWAGVGLGAQLSEDFLAVFFGTMASVVGALLGRNLQATSVWDFISTYLAPSGKRVAGMAAPSAAPQPAPAPRSKYAQPVVSRNVAVGGSEEGDICLVCTDDTNRVRPGDMCITCPECGARHHPECWEQNGGCGALHETR